jgi:hypothetical protein
VEAAESGDAIPAAALSAMLCQFANNNHEVVKKRKEVTKELKKGKRKRIILVRN